MKISIKLLILGMLVMPISVNAENKESMLTDTSYNPTHNHIKLKKPNAITEAQNYVKDELKDPLSAVFQNDRIEDRLVKGEVNGKNSYGGYVGFQSYEYGLDDNHVKINGQSRVDRVLKEIDEIGDRYKR